MTTKRFTASCLTIALFIFCSVPSVGNSTRAEIQTGRATFAGAVTVDGSPASFRQTIISGTDIVTGSPGQTTLDLVNRARLSLHSNSVLRLAFTTSDLSASLPRGSMQGFVPAGVSAEIITTKASIKTDASEQTEFQIQSDETSTILFVESGRVEFLAGSESKTVTAGQSYSTGPSGSPEPAPPQNLSGRRKGFLLLGVGGAVAVLLIALTGGDDEVIEENGCAIILSPIVGGPTCP